MADEPRTTGIGVSRRAFLAGTGVAGTTALAGCFRNTGPAAREASGSGGLADGRDLSGQVTVTGSSTVYPISVAMAEEFQKRHQGVNISVDSTGTGGGFKNHFCPGNSDVNGASRPIEESEREQCNSNGVTPVEFQVAGDALTVAVNNEADWVDCMTFDQLAQIWRPDGAQQWSDVDPAWPDEKLELYGPASTSGTFDWFAENVVGSGTMREDYEATEEDNIIVQGVEGSKYALGFLGYAYYEENRDRVKALAIKKDGGGQCTEPSLENARSGDYPMARPLFIYPAKESLQKPQVREFLRFYLKQAETNLVKQIGYVPSSAEQRQQNMDALERAIQDVR